MKTLQLTPQDQNNVIGKSLELKRSIEYITNDVKPHFEQMESWEVKEYKNVLENDSNELEQNKAYMMENQSVFNNVLSKYDLTVVTFISKFLQ